MAFTKIKTQSLTELFVQHIQDMILSGELKPGMALPPVQELMEKMGVSRQVVAPGLAELQKMGFIEIKPRVGSFVCDYRRTGTVETLDAILRYNGRLRKQETVSVMQLRTPVESLCVQLVIENASKEELASMVPFLDAIKTASAKGPEETAQAAFTFHHELAVRSGNMLLPMLYHSFQTTAMSLWTLYCRHNENGCIRLYENKRRLFEAIIERNVEKALEYVPGEYPREYKDYTWPNEQE